MTAVDPSTQVFWLASRALGIVALVLLSVSVSLGLAMSGRLLRRPGLPAKLKRYHEAATLVTVGLIAAHGGVLLLDGWLRPSLAGVTLPFALGYRPFWTGLGVIGAGTDGRAPWMLALLAVLVAPNVFALAYRMLPAAPRTPQGRTRSAGRQRLPLTTRFE